MPERHAAEEVVAALDELYGAIDRYRTSEGFKELLNFLAKLPTVGPYNGLLLHIQRPGAVHVATVGAWQRLGREVKPEALPLVTLKAFGPVEFVYDVADTVGDDLPPDVSDPFRAVGILDDDVLHLTCLNAESDQISVMKGRFGPQFAGRVSGQQEGKAPRLLRKGGHAALIVGLNETLSPVAQYATLIHELAHVYCGHLGLVTGCWWPDRRNLDATEREFEAEAVTWIVFSRKGFDPGSYRYLESYLRPGSRLPDISLNQIMVVANYIETLANKRFRPKKPEAPARGVAPLVGVLSQNSGKPWQADFDEQSVGVPLAPAAPPGGPVVENIPSGYRIELLSGLVRKYRNYLRWDLSHVWFGQTENECYLEIHTAPVARGSETTVEHVDLDFISEGDSSFFDPSRAFAVNAQRLMDELDAVTIAHCLNLFTREAAEAIIKETQTGAPKPDNVACPLTEAEAASEIAAKQLHRVLILADRLEKQGLPELAKALRSDVASYDPKPWHDPLDYWINLLELRGFVTAEKQAWLQNHGEAPTILF